MSRAPSQGHGNYLTICPHATEVVVGPNHYLPMRHSLGELRFDTTRGFEMSNSDGNGLRFTVAEDYEFVCKCLTTPEKNSE